MLATAIKASIFSTDKRENQIFHADITFLVKLKIISALWVNQDIQIIDPSQPDRSMGF